MDAADGTEIATNTKTTMVALASDSASPATAVAQPSTDDESMSKQSQLAIVATSSLLFAGLLVYLSSVLYPLVVIGGAYMTMQQMGEGIHRDSRVWQSFQAGVDQCRSILMSRSDVTAAKRATASYSQDDLITTVPLTPPTSSNRPESPVKRRSRIVTVKSSKPPSLRVTNVEVTDDGVPSALPEDSQDVLNYIVEPNSIDPYEFENEFMKGRLLFLLQRPDQPLQAKYKNLFEGKRRLFWVQLQVQFKKVASGILYISGEVPRSMNLGFFTGGLTKIILSVLQSLVRGLHCSFGQLYPGAAKTHEDEELPHICFPLYTAVDQFVVTPPGGKLPVLGTADFGESKESMSARRKHGQPLYQYNTTDTYSLHFHSFFIDFAKWRLNGLPGMKDTELSTFWEDMPLRLCAYSLRPQPGLDPNSESDAKKAVHSWNAKEYKFCFQLSHKVQDEYKIVDEVDDNDAPSSYARSLSEVEVQEAETRAELASYEFTVPAWFEYFSSSPAHAERRVGYALRVRRRNTDASDSSSTSAEEYFILLTAVAAFSPLSFVEHDLTYTVRRGSGRGSVFSASKLKTLEESISIKSHQSRYGKIDEERRFLEHHLQSIKSVSSASTRFSPEQVYQAQTALLEILQGRVASLSVEWPYLESAFVRSNSFGSSTNTNSDVDMQNANAPIRETLHAASQIVRAISATCWRNEWVTLDKSQRTLRIFRMMASAPSCMVSLDAILQLAADVSFERYRIGDEEPLTDLFWLRIVTIERCHHIAFAAAEDRAQWINTIRVDIERGGGRPMDSLLKQPIFSSCQRVEMESFVTDTTTKSRGAKRSVLNDRCEFFTHHGPPSSDIDVADPNAIVSSALKQAIRLQHDRLADYATREFLGFLDIVCLLKWTNLDRLEQDERERKVFLLNLYHLMLLHSSILGFLPKSKTQWSKFFNGVSYIIGGTHLSIAEVEHGLIRAPMAPLKLAIAFLVIPKVTDADNRASLHLTTGDFRANFALNCLTKSCVNSIMVFNKDELDSQLDYVTTLMAEYGVSYDRESKIVFLPKVCEWYRADFTQDPTSRWQQTCLSLLRKYMRGSKAQLVDYLLQHERTLVSKWKFAKYDYRFHESIHEASLADD